MWRAAPAGRYPWTCPSHVPLPTVLASIDRPPPRPARTPLVTVTAGAALGFSCDVTAAGAAVSNGELRVAAANGTQLGAHSLTAVRQTPASEPGLKQPVSQPVSQQRRWQSQTNGR